MKAVIIKDGKILLLREAKTYEEGTNYGRYHLSAVGEWQPVIKGVPRQIVATFIVCKPTSDKEVILSDEHDDFQWIDPAKWSDYDVMGLEGEVISAYLAQVK